MSDVKDLIELCKGEKIYIQTHNFPDPDAIASAFGLQKLLEEYGIDSVLCYEGHIDHLSTRKMIENFDIHIYSYSELINDMGEDDYIICVDSQKNAGNITDFIGNEIACIDHHPCFVKTEYKYSDIRITGACASIIAGYYKELGKTPEQNVASALLYGIRMDTLQLSRGVTMFDLEMVSFLFPLGDIEQLNKLEKNTLEIKSLKAYGAAIENIQLYGSVGMTGIPFSCPDALIAILADFILALDEVDVSVIYSNRDDGVKFSVRSEIEAVHAGKLINQALDGIGFGGGHAAMAGGRIPPENMHELGIYPDNAIREMFMEVIENMKKQAVR